MQRLRAAIKILAGYHMQEWSPNRRYNVDHSRAAHRDIPYGVRRRMLDWSREMERKDPLFNRYLDLREQYVCGPTGIRMVSASQDRAWAERANAEWEAWQPWCDIASRFSFGTLQGLIDREEAVAGEVFIWLKYGSSLRPRIQIVPSENCETPPELRVTEEGRTIFDGVRRDENGRPVSYYFRDDNIYAPKYEEIPAESVVHLFEPSRIGQSRGLPILYPVLKDMLDLQELQDYEMLAAKDASRTSKVITTQTGELSDEQLIQGATTATDTSGKKTYYDEVLGGESVVLQNGDTYNQFASSRPSVVVQQFWDYVSARIAAGLGIPIEVLIARSLQGTMTRAVIEMAAAYFRCRTAVKAEHFGRVFEFVVMSTPSLRSKMPTDWRRVKYTPPRGIDVDIGYNADAVLKQLAAGLTTRSEICAATGQDWERDILPRWMDEAEKISAEASSRGIDLSIFGGMSAITQPTPQNQPEPVA